MKPNDNRKTIIIAVSFGFILLVFIMLGFYFSNLNQSAQGEKISIKNFDQYVKNIPSDERTELEKTLYSTVRMNNVSEETIQTISDAVIREGSYEQDKQNDIYKTAFIVDVESIKQSYKIENLYSKLDPEQSGLYDYTRLVRCVDTRDLLYGEFDCKDRTSQERGLEKSDPILQYLPLSTLDYTVRQDTNSKELKLIAEISLSAVDYKMGEEASVTEYKNRLRAWFDSKGLSIDDYSITYKY